MELERNKAGKLKVARRAFTLEFKAGALTQDAGRRTVSPEQAEIARMKAGNSRLKMEVSILKKSSCAPTGARINRFRSREPVKYAFIESDLVVEFPLPVMCRVLRVTQASYHA